MFRFAILLFLTSLTVNIKGHGRFMKPPSRSSIWRIPEFSHFNPPINYDDDALYCGTIHQDLVVGGNCGICGDPFAQSMPRDNELNGKYYRGIITANYKSGEGYMEWRMCTTPNSGKTKECLNKNLLQLADGSGSKLKVTSSDWYRIKLNLPTGVTCSHCVIQWNYRAGNNWGQCEDGSYGLGCGEQETFRGCFDITIA